jgi:hypothetical protein
MAPVVIPLAGKLLPFLLKAGSAAKLPAFLRTVGAVGGATPSLLRGDLGGALLGGGLGALGTAGFGQTLTGAGTALGAQGVKALGKTAVQGLTKSQLRSGVQALGQTAVPLAGGLALGRLAGGGGSQIARGAAGLAGYGLTGGEGMGGSALPPGMGPYGMVSPTGSPIDVLNPLGLEAGRRTRTVKDAEALRDAQNIVLPTVRKFSEQAKKDDFQRSLAAEGIKANLLLNRNLSEGLAQATRQMGTTAAEQAGSALTTQYNY